MATSVFDSQRRCFWSGCPNQGEENLTLKKCARCKSALYCSISCQRNDWPQHKVVCIKKRDQPKEEIPVSKIMQMAAEALQCEARHDQIMKSIEKAKSRLALISERLGSSEARLAGERILTNAKKCLRDMLDPDWSKVDIFNTKTFSARMSIEEGFRELERLKDEAENLVKEYSKKKPPSLDHLSDKEKEDLVLKTIDENMSQIDILSDKMVFLISNKCGIIDGKLSEKVKNKIALIKDINFLVRINTVIAMETGLFS